MTDAIWQGDLYRRPLKNSVGEPLWELLLCDRNFGFTYGEFCPQSAVTADWLAAQLQQASDRAPCPPVCIEIFRPQALSLFQAAAQSLAIPVIPRRDTTTLHQWLIQRAAWYPTLDNFTGEAYTPILLEQPPPNPLPQNLWGNQWRFAAISAGELEQSFALEPIPIQSLPLKCMPLQAGLPSPTPIPGVVIDAGRRAMPLAQWLQQENPVGLNYIAGSPDGLILEAGLVDRWIVATFEDEEVRAAAQTFTARKQQSRGIHFLLVQPDDSGMTYTGLWLMR